MFLRYDRRDDERGFGTAFINRRSSRRRPAGLTGMYGWIAFALGAIAFVGGIVALRAYPAWLGPAELSFGVVVLTFAVWLALFIALAGASVIVAASIVWTFCRVSERRSP